MRLVTYVHKGSTQIGAAKNDEIVDLTGKLNGGCHTMLELIAEDHLPEIKDILEKAAADVDLASVTMLPPVPKPQKIWCIGVNYKDRNEEYKDQSALPRYPKSVCSFADFCRGSRSAYRKAERFRAAGL